MQPLFFTSDTHFGHALMIEKLGRPFADVNEMDEQLIHLWNAKVPRNAMVFHLGDVSFRKMPDTLRILRRLNGTKCLVTGPDGTRAVLDHFPLLTWNKSHYGAWHLHGHSHGSLRPPAPLDRQRRMDVGIDTHPNLQPYSWDEIAEFMATKDHAAVDHHEEKPTG